MAEIVREPILNRKTAISYKTEEKTVVRGYDLDELAEKGYTFIDAIFVLFQGRIPTSNEQKMLDYEMGEFLEHSMSPSASSAICVMGGRPMLPAAIAASIMTFGGAHGPGAAHTYMMNYYLERALQEGKSLKEMAKKLVEEHMEADHPVMGIGQPQHIYGDPRAIPTFRKTEQLGTAGIYHDFQIEIQNELNRVRLEQGKKKIYPNMIGAGNSTLMDLGFSGLAGWVIGCVTRGYSCAVHAIETLKKGHAWAASTREPMVQMLDLSMIEYEGIPDRVVPEQEQREDHAERELEKGEWKKWNL
jgi:citrate synthase